MASQDDIPSDEELMTRAAGGDVDAFEQLVQRHQRSALSTARRFLGRSALAEDVVQEAFLKIFVRASDYRPTARFRTYLYNVIWHLCVDTFRRKRPLVTGKYISRFSTSRSVQSSSLVPFAVAHSPPELTRIASFSRST